MPVIINSAAIHPFLPSLGTPLAIESARAEHQDIRPLEIAIINLMADKQTTERQLALWLGNTSLQVKLTFATTDTYFRDVNAGVPIKMPHNYFPHNDDTLTPLNRWRSHAHLLFGNWINEIYQTTS